MTPGRKRVSKPADYVPDPVFPPGHRIAGHARCQAWSPNQGRQCEKSPVKGKRVCGSHGGRTPGGFASPHYRGKGRSKYLPTRLLARYEESIQDKELLSLRDDLALVEARLSDLLTRVDTGESGRLWKNLQELSEAFDNANAKKDMEAAAVVLSNIRGLIKRGLADWAIWSEVMDALETRRRLVESEARRLERMQMMITAQDATFLVESLAKTVLEAVSDPRLVAPENSRRLLARIQTGLTQLVGTANGRYPDAD